MSARAARSPAVQRWAGLSLAGSLGPLDRRGVCGAVFRAVRPIPFEADERQLAERFGLRGPELDRELLVAPEVLIEQQRPRGDCDCKAMLGAACLLALGVPCCFTVLDRSGRKWEHVYVQAALEDGSLYPLDFSHGPLAGWQAGGAVRRGNAPMMRPPISDDVLKRHAREHAAMRRRGLSGLGFEAAQSGGPSWWQQLLASGAQTGFRIAEGRFGGGTVPTFEMTQLPDGTQTVIQRGGGAFLDNPVGSLSAVNPLWLVAGAGVLLLVFKK